MNCGLENMCSLFDANLKIMNFNIDTTCDTTLNPYLPLLLVIKKFVE